jgi:hypothetical protein
MKQRNLFELLTKLDALRFLSKYDHILIRKIGYLEGLYYYEDFIESAYCDFMYNTDLVLNKVDDFLGGKVTDAFSTYIAQIDRSRSQSLERDWVFVLVKEDETIEGTFAHCNYKMVWPDVYSFIEWMYRGDKERDNLLDEDEHNRLCEIEEEVE